LCSERGNDQRQLARQKWHAQPTEPPVASGRCGDKPSKSVGAHSREGKAEEAHFFSEPGRARQKRRTSSLNAEMTSGSSPRISGTPSRRSRRSPAAEAGDKLSKSR
ncbi:unnamed protein product, partial [Prorocentrum cordatum]